MNNSKEFFNELAIECGFQDIDSAKRIYHALVRLLLRELKENDRVELPEFGRLSIKIIGKSGKRAVPNPDGTVKEKRMRPSKAITFASCRLVKDKLKTWREKE
jgi:nucleoid DNA-binding protein